MTKEFRISHVIDPLLSLNALTGKYSIYLVGGDESETDPRSIVDIFKEELEFGGYLANEIGEEREVASEWVKELIDVLTVYLHQVEAHNRQAISLKKT